MEPLTHLPGVATIVAMRPAGVPVLVCFHVWRTPTQVGVGILLCVPLLLVASPAYPVLRWFLVSSPTTAAAAVTAFHFYTCLGGRGYISVDANAGGTDWAA